MRVYTSENEWAAYCHALCLHRIFSSYILIRVCIFYFAFRTWLFCVARYMCAHIWNSIWWRAVTITAALKRVAGCIQSIKHIYRYYMPICYMCTRKDLALMCETIGKYMCNPRHYTRLYAKTITKRSPVSFLSYVLLHSYIISLCVGILRVRVHSVHIRI